MVKLDRVTAENFLGVRQADIELTAPVTLVVGPNGSGKSSLRDAIIYCALGVTARARLLKKDLAELLHPDAKRGEASLTIDGRTYTRGVPSGNFSTASLDPPEHWDLLLDPGAFLRQDAKGRRATFLAAMGISMSAPGVMGRLSERGYDEAILAEVRPLLASGWESAAAESQGLARGLKGRWRQITGRDWGPKAGAEWRDPHDIDQADDGPNPCLAIQEIQTRISDLDQQIGARRREIGLFEEREAERARAAKDADRARARYQADREEWEQMQAEAATRPAAAKDMEAASDNLRAARENLDAAIQARDEARTDAWGEPNYVCTECGAQASLEWDHDAPDGAGAYYDRRKKRLIDPAIEKSIDAALAARTAAALDLSTQKAKLARLDLTISWLNDHRMPPEEPAPIDRPREEPPQSLIEKIRTLEAQRAGLMAAMSDARAKADAYIDRLKRIADAMIRTQTAGQLYAQIEVWLRLAADLSPSGLPSEMMEQALGPVNAALEISGSALGFVELRLTSDMDLLGRPAENDPRTARRYELLSESAKWRAEAALADALGPAGLPMLLDRFEVLDGANRGKAVSWLESLDRQAILFGALRDRDVPAGLSAGIAVHWLRQGHIFGSGGY